MTTTTTNRPVGVDELRRAWHALQEGQFRGRRQPIPQRRAAAASQPDRDWEPVETILPVVGCVGQCGASALALALATAAGGARVIECCTATASGLASAATAELGRSPNGWTLGRRGRVSIARTTGVQLGADELPTPDEPATTPALTVLDVGWELGHALATPGWLRDQLRHAETVIAATTATIPGLRRLETALSLLGPGRTVVAVLGPARRRWPRHLSAALGPQATAADQAGLLIAVAADKHLATRGLDSSALPASLLHAAENLLRHTGAGGPDQKGQPT